MLPLLCALLAATPEADVADAGLPVDDAGVVELDAGVVAAPEPALPPHLEWFNGDHLTGEWGGARTWLADHGITLDFVYAAEVFTQAAAETDAERTSLIGHLDVGLGFDTGKLGLWPGGRFYVLGQANHGHAGVNQFVGSPTEISNIEAPPYLQLGEFFLEQTLFDEKLLIRLGKQDANRDFGTPRFGGNFINNNFGMFPTDQLMPSYPIQGLGATVVGTPVKWLALKASFYEGSPKVGSFGFDSAFAKGAGWTTVGGVAVTKRFGEAQRTGGTTSLGAWYRAGEAPALGTGLDDPPVFNSNWGFFAQTDQRIFKNPLDPEDQTSATIIARVAWSQPDRNIVPFYAGMSFAWHGLGARADDTIGAGWGYLSVSEQQNGTPGRGSEFFVEVFYKWRLTKFMSLQPDVQYHLHPGGDGRDALLVGARLKFKL